jgi:hypothetical protein
MVATHTVSPSQAPAHALRCRTARVRNVVISAHPFGRCAGHWQGPAARSLSFFSGGSRHPLRSETRRAPAAVVQWWAARGSDTQWCCGWRAIACYRTSRSRAARTSSFEISTWLRSRISFAISYTCEQRRRVQGELCLTPPCIAHNPVRGKGAVAAGSTWIWSLRRSLIRPSSSFARLSIRCKTTRVTNAQPADGHVWRSPLRAFG